MTESDQKSRRILIFTKPILSPGPIAGSLPAEFSSTDKTKDPIKLNALIEPTD